jgi:guanylate kinase
MTPTSAISKNVLPAAKGHLFILSAPSGAGKTTLCQAILRHFPDMLYSVSHTTRPPRTGETPGIDYHFITQNQFLDMIAAGEWAEWAEVHGNHYGTSAHFLNQWLDAGKDILLDIDVQGMAKILMQYPASITFFIQPPSIEALRTRMESRGSDSPEIIETRMINATKEMAEAHRYRHIVINDDLNTATEELIRLIDAYRHNCPLTLSTSHLHL